MRQSAQIVCGEVLVAIPIGYAARKVAKLGQQILANPRITKMIESADTASAPSKTKKRVVRRIHRRRRVSTVRKILEKPDENKTDENKPNHSVAENGDDDSTVMEKVHIAMKKAAW